MFQQNGLNNQSNNHRYILDPYRTLGSFVSGKLVLSQTQPFSIAVPTNDSYKIYSDTLAIKVVSPPLSAKVESVLCYNQYSYVKAGQRIIKMKYHHIVKEWKINNDNLNSEAKSTLMKFDTIILMGQGSKIYVIDQKQNSKKQLDFFEVKQQFNGMIHPVTYINKVIVYNQTSMTLVNPISQKILYEYPNLRNYLKQNSLTIVLVESSKLVNIVALSLSNGQIIIFNLKKDQIVFKVKVKLAAIAIAFCDQESMMATSDQAGNVFLWDLKDKKILYKFQQFVQGPIDSLVFVPGQPIITCGSSAQNCIKQLRINLEDNRILTLFRQRVGITQPIEKVTLLNNNQLVLNSKSESMFTSLYSHTNNYKLNRVLDSSSPFHLISRHFSVQLFKNQTMQKSFNIHESAFVGKISLSQKYYIVGTKSRLIKLGVSGIQAKISGIKQIILFQEHYIFVITHTDVIVLDFATFTPIQQLKIGKCSKSAINQYGNLLALFNEESNSIKVYDMEKIQLARQYKIDANICPFSLCFSSDNKYLLSSHQKSLKIWSIVHNNLFKQFNLEHNIVNMCFTEDNQFFLSVFENQREVNIWNNYIGKILSNRQTQVLRFHVTINHCEQDFRHFLKRKLQNAEQNNLKEQQTQTNFGDLVLDSIQDSIQEIAAYKFEFTQKWLPLIYYDQIKDRNTIQNPKQISFPFFLDFSNIDEEKKKLKKQIKDDMLSKKQQKQQKIDKNLQDQSHEINLNDLSDKKDFKNCIQQLQNLSIAQIDYQLRTYLLNPSNKINLLKMFEYLSQKKQQHSKVSEQFVNVIFHRTLYLIGNQIFDSQLKQSLKNIITNYKLTVKTQKQKVDKCVSIIDKMF